MFSLTAIFLAEIPNSRDANTLLSFLPIFRPIVMLLRLYTKASYSQRVVAFVNIANHFKLFLTPSVRADVEISDNEDDDLDVRAIEQEYEAARQHLVVDFNVCLCWIRARNDPISLNLDEVAATQHLLTPVT